ncbi:MAG TPA: sodium-dependent bicarbonate transport family permease [Steroidobacteraceae bacterium]|nr:sodium-dependent bicarbonate transport family permease [Steroidobacteraceae bacterium]
MITLDPVILFFLLGALAGLARAELRLPAAIYEFISMLLLLTIGLKGGVELARADEGLPAVELAALLALGFGMPVPAFLAARHLGRLSRADAASIAAHYGSVSVGTFAVLLAYLGARGIAFEARAPVWVAILEVPAILTGIVLARGLSGNVEWKSLLRELLLGRSIVLLLGGLAIGFLSGPAGTAAIEPLFFDLFKGILALFLLEMGLIAASQLPVLKRNAVFLVGFGVLMPLAGAVVGALLGRALGLSPGGATVLATLAASASYIAAPTALRTALPEANPALGLTASLAVTFPFNILVGIPLYERLAMALFD